jgi:hypothetical protein
VFEGLKYGNPEHGMIKGKRDRSGSKARMVRTRVTKVTLKSSAHEHYKGMENALSPSFSVDFKTLDEDGIRNDVRNSLRHGFFSSICGRGYLHVYSSWVRLYLF